MTSTAQVEKRAGGERRGLPQVLRNGLAGFWIFMCLSFLGEALTNGAWLGALAALAAAGLGFLLTSVGKAWRAKHGLKIPGWLLALAAVLVNAFGALDVDAAQTARQHRLFESQGPQILQQATSALRRGDVSEAQSLLDPIDDIDLPQVEVLSLAATAITEAGGDVDGAQQKLLARSRTEKNGALLAQAAKALELPPKPKVAAAAPAPAIVLPPPPKVAEPASQTEVEDDELPPPSKATLAYVREVLGTWGRLQSCRIKPGFRSAGLAAGGPCGDLNADLARLQADPQASEAMSHGFDCLAGDIRTVAISYALGEQGPDAAHFRSFIGRKIEDCRARLR